MNYCFFTFLIIDFQIVFLSICCTQSQEKEHRYAHTHIYTCIYTFIHQYKNTREVNSFFFSLLPSACSDYFCSLLVFFKLCVVPFNNGAKEAVDWRR